MSVKRTIFAALIVMFGISTPYAAMANTQTEGEPKVLIIYSSESGKVDEDERMLDLLVGHFTTDITLKSSEEVEKKDLTGVSHVIYFGKIAKEFQTSFHTLFEEFAGSFMAIGYNVEHLGDRFSFIEPKHEVVVDELYFIDQPEKSLKITPEYVIDIKIEQEKDIVVAGKHQRDNAVYPIGVKSDNNYYFAIDNFHAEKTVIIGDILHDFFQVKHDEIHPAYIRLEDIHPLVDPEYLRGITNLLKEKNIPFMMAVIPVYTNPETGKEYHFSDSPKLLKVLKDAQKNGGSIVLHGYTHQFRLSETGEGFEFWDVVNNTPIYSDVDENFKLKTEVDFPDNVAYEQYIDELKQFESEYIRKKITRGIQELANYGLYPLAFEAPHYTMSQHGYEILSEYFSTYVGQVQLSDTDWEIMNTVPYETTPTFFKGMKLLPETMGYVQPNDPNSVNMMMQRADKFSLTIDGMTSAFYHPYLGLERFIDVIEKMEEIENIQWIDLKKMDVWVKAENVEITTENGTIIPKVKKSSLFLTSFDFLTYHINRLVEILIWVIATVGGIAVAMFIGFTIFLTYRKEELE